MAKTDLYDFEHLNTTTESIYELREFNVLIILTNGTNLTNWKDVENREDILFISEDLFGETSIEGRYKDLVNLKAVVTFGVGNIASTKEMFSGCESLVEIAALDKWDVSLVTDTSNMFDGCSSLEDISALENWNMSNVIDMSCMFRGCSSLEEVSALKDWDVSHVDDMHYLFADCVRLKDISALKDWDVSNVRDAACLFEFCTSLEDISALKKWNLVNAFNVTALFRSCASLKNISALSNWDLGKMTNNKSLLSLFAYCYSLKSISALKKWDLSNITRISALFEGCVSLKSVSDLKKWDVSNVTSFEYLFKNCSSLTDISALKSWDISNVMSLKSMFKHCEDLEDVSDLKDWDVSNIRSMEGMFKQCDSLVDVSSLSQWNLSENVTLDHIFDDCELLEIYPEWFKVEVIKNSGFDKQSRKRVIENLDESFFKTNNLNDFSKEQQLYIVQSTSNQSLLAFIVDRSQFKEISGIAFSKITDESVLAEIALHDHNYDVLPSKDSSNPLDLNFFFYNREKAFLKIENQAMLVNIAKESPHTLNSIEYLGEYVDNEDIWVDITLNAKSKGVRFFAFTKLQSESAFQRIIDESSDEKLLIISHKRIDNE